MAGRDKERDRGHAHRSNGSKPVQAASAELARQGTGACAEHLLAHRSSEVIQAVAIVAMSVQPLCWLPLELVQQLLSEMPGQLGLGSLRKRGYIPYGGCGEGAHRLHDICWPGRRPEIIKGGQ